MALSCAISNGKSLTAITIACSPGKPYLPVDEASLELDRALRKSKNEIQLNELTIPSRALRRLTAGTWLVSTDDLNRAGAELAAGEQGLSVVSIHGRGFNLSPGVKRVEISLKNQQLQAW